MRAAMAAVLACCLVAGGVYASYAYGLSQSDYTWFLRNPDADEFVISKPAELNALAQLVNGTAKVSEDDSEVHDPVDFAGKRVVVDAPDKTMALNTLGTSNQTVPIGTAEHPFNGTFDGNGLTVTGLLITGRTDSNTGFFGVVGASGSVSNVKVEGAITVESDTPLSNVGGVVGDCQGSLSGCASSVKVFVENTFTPTKDLPTPLNNIGGVAGRVTGQLSGCTFEKSGSLTVRDAQDAVINDGNNALPLALGVGGVVGMFGSADEATTGIAIDNCSNKGALYLSFTGLGGKDRFGEQVISKPAAVGGIAGYSSGSIANCSNEGELRTSTKSEESGKDDAQYGYGTTYDNGATQLGGIVGNLRNLVTSSHFSAVLEPDNGTKDNQLEVRNCWNKGLVIGSAQTGGIVGTAGTYTLITECSNGNYTGNNRESDGQLVDKKTQGAVVCTRWNKPYAGGIVGTTMGSVTFCSNRAQVNNTQAGYYIAGIAGGLGSDKIDTLETIKNDPSYECEMHSCWNSGQIGLGHKQSNKFGALLGLNDGYVHDCVVLEGCVIIGQQTDGDDQITDEDKTGSDAIGDLAWKNYRNISVLKEADVRSSSGLAILNSYAQQANGFANYWFSGEGTSADGGNYNDKYPVLRSWAEPHGATDIGTVGLTELSCDFAPYNPVVAPVPTVSLGTADGAKLVQNVDYVIRAQDGAKDMTVGEANETPYRYTVVGIGKYTGEMPEFGKYGIGAGTLEDMSVHVSEPKFNWEVQYPESVKVLDRTGVEVPSDNYDYVIYDSATNNLRSKLSPKLVAFDSAGYISFDEGATLEPALEAQKNTKGKTFKVYDRNKALIADSEGGVYDPETGALVTGTAVNTVSYQSGSKTATSDVVAGAGTMNFKEKQVNQPLDYDCDAGYVLEVQGKGAYENSSTTGRYIIRAANMAEDCKATVSYDGQQWLYDNLNHKLYQEVDGQKVWGMDVDFTGDPIRPDISVTYLDRELGLTDFGYMNDEKGGCYYGGAVDRDYKILYGPVSKDVVIEANPYPNRTAADFETAAPQDVPAVTAAFDTGSNVTSTNGQVLGVRCFDNYIMCAFDINGVDLAECDVTVSDQAVPQGDSEVSPVHVALKTEVKQADGTVKQTESVLKEGTDYTVAYLDAAGNEVENPTAKGSYQAVVTPKAPNLTGSAVTKPFAIVDAQTFKVQALPTTWHVDKNYPDLEFTDAAGKELDLTYGVDYTYEIYQPYSTVLYANVHTKAALPYVYWTDIYTSPFTVKVTGLGKYAGAETIDLRWKINPLDLATTKTEDWTIEGDIVHAHEGTYDRIYNSVRYLPIFYQGYRVSGLGSEALTLLSEPTGNVHAGDEVSVVLKAALGRFFSGTKTLGTYTVQPCALSAIINWHPDMPEDLAYTGSAWEPVKIRDLTEGEDYTIAYKNNVDAGTAGYVVTGIGDFTGTRTGSFTIEPKQLTGGSSFKVEAIADQAYTGGQVKPAIVVKDGDVTLDPDKDYTVVYGANVEGTGTVYVSGKGNYATPANKELSASFAIVKDSQKVTYWVEYVDETGDPVAASKEVSGKKAGDTVEEHAIAVPGYTLLDASQDVQTLQLTADQKNVITFVYAKKADAAAKDLADAQVSDAPDQLLEVVTRYNPGSSQGDAPGSEFAKALKDAGGKGLADGDIWKRYGAEPSFELAYGGEPLVEGVDYEVSYDEHRNVGAATATFTGLGDFAGTAASKDYRIVGYVAHKIDTLEYKTVTKTSELDEYWQGVGTDKTFKVPNWGTSSEWTGTPLADKFRVFLADGTAPASFKVSVADPLALHPEDNHEVPVYDLDSIDEDRRPADAVELSAADGSWKADALYTFTKTYPGYKRTEYSLSDLYAVGIGSPTYLYQASGMGKLAEAWAGSAQAKAELKSDLVARLLGAEADRGASLVEASFEAAPAGSLSWSVAAPAKIGSVSVSDAGLSDAIKAAVDAGFFENWPVAASYKQEVRAKVMPYDLTPSGEDGSYAGVYAKVKGDFLATLSNGGYDGSSAASLAHGAKATVNGGDPLTATGEPLDVAGELSVEDAFGGDVMKSADAVPGTDYAVSFERKGADGAWAPVSEVVEPGSYRATVTGACKSVGSSGSILSAANRRLYAGSVSAEFEVVADAAALDAAIAKADASLADVPVSADGKDVANGAAYVSQDVHDALGVAVLAAKTARAEEHATQEAFDAAAKALEQAQKAFDEAKQTARTNFDVLGAAIDAAQALLDGAVSSDDGLDVPGGSAWATPENKAALQQAIETAQGARDDDGSTQHAVDAAADALGAAVKEFNDVLNTAEPSKTSLRQAVEDAQAKRAAAAVSTDGADVANGALWTTRAAADAFEAAIETARGVVDSDAASQNQVNQAKAALEQAAASFGEFCAKAAVSYDALTAANATALADRANTVVAEKADDVYVNRSWVKQSNADAFDAVLTRVQTALREQALSQSATNALAGELARAQASFDAAKQKGAKPLPVESVAVSFDKAFGNKGTQAHATVLPEGCTTDVTWSSSDESVASVDASGKVTVHRDGVVAITATSTADPGKSGKAAFAAIGMAGTTTKQDAPTGVTVQGVPSGTEVVVSRGDDVVTSVDGAHKVIGSFDVELWAVDAQGVRQMLVQPLESLTLVLPVAEGFAGKPVTVHAYHADGSEQTFSATVAADNTVTISGVDCLSRFEVTAAVDEGGSAADDPTLSSQGSTSSLLAPTGDGTAAPAVVGTALAAMVLAMLAGRRMCKASDR